MRTGVKLEHSFSIMQCCSCPHILYIRIHTTLHIDSLSAVRNRMFVGVGMGVGVCTVCGVVCLGNNGNGNSRGS